MDETLKRQHTQLNLLYRKNDTAFHQLAVHFKLADSALWLLLSMYDMGEPCTQARLCTDWYMSKQTLHSAMKSLEKQGLIFLQADPDNRKTKQIYFTPLGHEKIKQVIDPIIAAQTQALRQMSKRDREAFLALSKQHMQNFKAEIDKLIHN